MTRHLLTIALLASPAVASAQVGTPASPGPLMIGGHVVSGPPIASGANALFPIQTAVPRPFSVGGGSMSQYPPVLFPSGPWGGVSYPWPEYPLLAQPIPVVGPISGPVVGVRPGATPPLAALSGRAQATLVVQFPAAAEIWVNGEKRKGDPTTEWTLTSPELQMESSHTFEVKGRWKADGKTFEVSRSVVMPAGDRNRWVVVSGTEVKK